MSDILLNKKIAELEFQQDQLLTEMQHIDSLLRAVGFSDGLSTIKATALELLNAEEE
jgi:hypothetical protein